MASKCQAETASGQRCKRNATVTFRREWEERFLIFFTRKKDIFYHYCAQHAERSMVGERVE